MSGIVTTTVALMFNYSIKMIVLYMYGITDKDIIIYYISNLGDWLQNNRFAETFVVIVAPFIRLLRHVQAQFSFRII